MSWLDGLRRELDGVGIRGRARRRILSELADHLACEPNSEGRLGSPAQVAARFAAELGVVRTRRSAYASFAALALTGASLLAANKAMSAAGGWPRLSGSAVASFVPAAGLIVFFLPQVAFVAGVLGLARALRIRRLSVTPAAELRLVQRRMAVAVFAGAGSTVAFGVQAVALNASAESGFSTWWVVFALATASASFVALAGAAASLRHANVVTPAGGSPARGLAADVPVPLQPFVRWIAARPTLLAAAIGVPAVALMLVGATVVEDSWTEGALRAVLEGIVFLGCFAALGRRLGLRR